jgi:hypothetical protein
MARSWRCARGNVVAAASAHSQSPVSVLHTDPTQLEQLSEHGHPRGIGKDALQSGGMSGQRVVVVEAVVVVVEVVDVVVDVVVEVVGTHTPGFRC